MPRPVIKELDLPQYTDSLDEMVDYLSEFIEQFFANNGR